MALIDPLICSCLAVSWPGRVSPVSFISDRSVAAGVANAAGQTQTHTSGLFHCLCFLLRRNPAKTDMGSEIFRIGCNRLRYGDRSEEAVLHAPGAHPVTHENLECRMSNVECRIRMRSGRIVAAAVASAPRKPLPSTIFDIRHSRFDILRAFSLGRAIFRKRMGEGRAAEIANPASVCIMRLN